jgi:hypothetical protein
MMHIRKRVAALFNDNANQMDNRIAAIHTLFQAFSGNNVSGNVLKISFTMKALDKSRTGSVAA